MYTIRSPVFSHNLNLCLGVVFPRRNRLVKWKSASTVNWEILFYKFFTVFVELWKFYVTNTLYQIIKCSSWYERYNSTTKLVHQKFLGDFYSSYLICRIRSWVNKWWGSLTSCLWSTKAYLHLPFSSVLLSSCYTPEWSHFCKTNIRLLNLFSLRLSPREEVQLAVVVMAGCQQEDRGRHVITSMCIHDCRYFLPSSKTKEMVLGVTPIISISRARSRRCRKKRRYHYTSNCDSMNGTNGFSSSDSSD